MKRFLKKIKTLFEWLPIIWNDKQHDHAYISQILIKKLEMTRDFFLSDESYIEGSQGVAKEITEVIELLKKTQDSYDHYDLPALIEIEKKWGQSKMVKVEGTNTYKLEVEGVKTESQRLEYDSDFKLKLDLARKSYMKDKVKAWTMIAKNIDKWWD